MADRIERTLARGFLITCGLLAALPALAQPRFDYDALPELPGGESELHGIAEVDPPPPAPFAAEAAVGTSLDDDGIRKAVFWSRADTAFTWELTTLPNPHGNADSSGLTLSGEDCNANGEDDFIDLYFAAGSASDENGDVQPVFWLGDELGAWTSETPPVPPPFDSGGIQFMDKAQLVDLILKNRMCGSVGQSGGPEVQHAAFWVRDALGAWTVDLLPDAGPGFASEALTIRSLPGDSDLTRIGGWAEPSDGDPAMPVIWDEQAGGGFVRTDLPLAPGAYRGTVASLACGIATADTGVAAGYNASPAALADFHTGVLYRQIAGVWTAPVALPPLPGSRDSRASGVSRGTTRSADGFTVVGHSYSEVVPGSERATLWEVEADDSVSVYDLNDQTRGVPPGVTLGAWTPDDMHVHSRPGGSRVGGTLGSGAGPGPGTPHAYILTLLPAGLPSFSPAGALALAASLAVTASAILRRRRARRVGARAGAPPA